MVESADKVGVTVGGTVLTMTNWCYLDRALGLQERAGLIKKKCLEAGTLKRLALSRGWHWD